MHGLESNAIVKLFHSQVIKFKSCLQKLLCGSQSVSDDQMFALVYRLCLRNKDMFTEIFCTSLNCVAYY